jgi:hypothetical protein
MAKITLSFESQKIRDWTEWGQENFQNNKKTIEHVVHWVVTGRQRTMGF